MDAHGGQLEAQHPVGWTLWGREVPRLALPRGTGGGRWGQAKRDKCLLLAHFVYVAVLSWKGCSKV